MQENSKEYVMYESFDELPDELKEKFKNESVGSSFVQAKKGYVDFINQLNKRSDKLVGDYINNSTKTQVEFCKCGHVSNISSNNYKHGVGCAICRGLQVQQGVNDLATMFPSLAKEWHPIKNGKLTPRGVTHGSGKKVWWQCEHGHEWEATIGSRTGGNGCPYCSNHRVLKGFNDIFTTHQQYVKYFVDIGDAHTHTYSSNKKVELKCPDCGHTKMMSISKLTHKGFSCDLCSDGISFPEKIVALILTKLNIEFIKQMSYNNGEHRYDFYLPKYNAILETHGIQHYEQRSRGRSLEYEQENDRYKRELAISNGILSENYHEIDCRYSTLDWCRPNIEKALGRYIDMSTLAILADKGWIEADIQAQKSLKIEVCKYWNDNREANGELTAQRVADVFGVGLATVHRYLNWGNTNGFCVYDGKKELKDSNKRRGTFAHLIKPNGELWFDEPMNIKELSRQTGITAPTLKNNLDKGALRYSNSAKYDPKYIGSYIVSAEVYDSQTQTS